MTDFRKSPVLPRPGLTGGPVRRITTAGDPPPRRVTLPPAVRGAVKHIGLILLTAVMLYPVLWMVVSSLRPNDVERVRAWTEQMKARLRHMNLELGLLANFYGSRLVITPVRVKR